MADITARTTPVGVVTARGTPSAGTAGQGTGAAVVVGAWVELVVEAAVVDVSVDAVVPVDPVVADADVPPSPALERATANAPPTRRTTTAEIRTERHLEDIRAHIGTNGRPPGRARRSPPARGC
jgi:hypothetical protein